MRIRPAAIVLIVLMALTTACAPVTDASSTRPLSYLALGDSYTIGESVTVEERWPVVLAETLKERGVEVAAPEIVARTGWTTDELDRAIDRADLQATYDLVTLLIGVNNQFRGRDLDEYRAEFAGLLDRAIGFAGDRPERVVVVSIPDWGATPFADGLDRALIASQIDDFNRVGAEEARRRGARFVDITPISRGGGSDLVAADGLHPSAAQYRAWVNLIVVEAEAALQS